MPNYYRSIIGKLLACAIKGVIKDVFIKIGKFVIPANFIILNFEADELLPVILGWLFLATDGALIDV